MRYYSPSTGGFYDQDINPTLPEDVVEVTEETYQAMFEGQAAGKKISYDDSGLHLRNHDVDLVKEKKRLHKVVNDLRDKAMLEGFEYAGNTYQADSVSYGNITSTIVAINSGMPLPDGFTWRSADDQDIDVTKDDILAMGEAALAYITVCYKRAWELKAEVDTAIAAINTSSDDIPDQVRTIRDSILW